MNANSNDITNDSEERMPNDKAAFDKDEALEIIQDDEEFLKELAEMFIIDFPGQMSKIKEAVDSHDNEALGESSHKMKGSVVYFGKRAAYETSLKLEMMGKENRLDGVRDIYDILVKDVGQLVNALKEFVEG